MLTISFNGQSISVSEETTIADLIHSSGIPSKFCAVEKNLEIVPKSQYASMQLADGDSVEIVTLVGGG